VDGSLSKAFEVDESVLDWITVHGYHPDSGARFLRRMIERHVTTAISDTIVRENPVPEDTIELSVRRNRIRARLPSKPPTSPTKLRETVLLPVGTTQKIRNLDLNQMIVEARTLVGAADNHLAGLESDRREAADLLAKNESVLSRLLPDLVRYWSKQPVQVDVSRIYGKDGVDEFLEGWRRTRG